MVVISGIITIVKTAIKIAPVAFRASKIVYKAGSKTKHGAQWIRAHPKIVKYGTAAAGAGSLLLDLTNIDYSAIQSQKGKPDKKQQTRSYFQSSRARQQFKSNCRPRYRYRPR